MNSFNSNIFNIFKILLKHFGPQYWWPAKTKFEIIIGALLAQGVNWKNVEKAILNLEREDLLIPQKLLKIDEKKLAQLIKPSRYPSIKAKRLKNLILFLKEFEFNLEKIERIETIELRKLLLKVNGIGKETADSILLYAFSKKIFVIDAYTKRIFERHGGKIKSRNNWYEELRIFFEKRIPENVNIYNEFHALFVQLGNSYCKAKNPLCKKCPIKNLNFL